MKIAVIDNYDSFVFNLIRYIKETSLNEVIVMRNDKIDYEKLNACDSILLSPGPGIPSEAGDLLKVISTYSKTKKILGVCLGHQAIGEYFGAKLVQCEKPVHGKSSKIEHFGNDSLFRGIPTAFEVGRYHSWKLSNLLSEQLIATSISSQKEIMSIKHKCLDVRGVQFHPESILTPYGRNIIENWLKE